MTTTRELARLSGSLLPFPYPGSVPHEGAIVLGAVAGQVHGVRGVVFDGERIGFTEHDNRGWDIPFVWCEEDETPSDAFERAAYEALGCYVRTPERMGLITLTASRPIGLPYGRSVDELRLALFIAAFERKELIEESGQNRTAFAPLAEYLEVPNLQPLRPWLLVVQEELRRRFSSLA